MLRVSPQESWLSQWSLQEQKANSWEMRTRRTFQKEQRKCVRGKAERPGSQSLAVQVAQKVKPSGKDARLPGAQGWRACLEPGFRPNTAERKQTKNTTKEVGIGWGRCLCSQCELGAGRCPLTLSLLLPLQDNQLGVMKELGKGGGYGCSNAMKTTSGV